MEIIPLKAIIGKKGGREEGKEGERIEKSGERNLI